MDDAANRDGATTTHARGKRPPPDTDDRFHGPHTINSEPQRYDAAAAAVQEAAADRRAVEVSGVAVPLLASGTVVHDLIQDLRLRASTSPEDLRAVSVAFGRHCAAKEATIFPALEGHSAAKGTVRRDREDAAMLLRMLDTSIAGREPAGSHALTAGGTLGDIDLYLAHEQRDLVPLINSELPPHESTRLAAAFRP